MGFFDEIKRLAHPYDDEMEEDEDEYEEDEYDLEDEEEDEPAPPPPPRDEPPRRQSRPVSDFPGGGARSDGKVVNIHTTAQLQVVLVKPERFETAAEIVDQLRGKRAVLINLETTPKDVTRRLVDFLSGAAYAIDGKVKKVAANTYIITPPNVDLVGDLMDELESSGRYF